LKKPYIIDAVYYDLPPNSSFRYQAFCSFPTANWVNEWSEYSFNHFFKARKGADLQTVEEEILKIPAIAKAFSEYPEYTMTLKFIPLKEFHFHPAGGRANKLFVNIMISVCIMVLLMAFINYMNFAIANTPRLAKSLSTRRILGETKEKLILLLSIESALLIAMSFALALFFVNIVLSLWPDILGYKIRLMDYSQIIVIGFLLFVSMGVLVSLIPTRIVLKAQPINAMKGLISLSPKNSYSSKILTVVQYSISFLLIIGLLFLGKQIQYMKNYDLGFDKENILVIKTTGEIRNQHKAFAEELMKYPNIKNYAYSQFIPGEVGMGWGRTIEGKNVSFKCWPVDEHYLTFMGFEITDGRTFSSSIEADENSFIFNQKALTEFGWTEDYLGKTIPGFGFTGPLVGVVKDIRYASLHEEIQPMAFWLTQTRKYRLSLKIANRDVANTIKHIEKIYTEIEPKIPLDYSFLDEELNNQYKEEEKQAELISIFCLISIFISSIGALGLIIFICESKVKEIGIRKINGASIFQVVNMLNMSLLKWILSAFIIAIPISWYLINNWLEGFAYRTPISWWIFALSGIIVFAISLIIITSITYKAAKNNPIESLRYE
ncbi:MAG: FtsX-like permease family protein, partial [Salinivirgaceae bacterium]